MADFPCVNPCPVCAPGPGPGTGPVDPANPFVNLSSEVPDVDDFFGRRYTPGGSYYYPPLGGTWYAIGCVGFCVSTESQQAADLCAQNQAVLCASVNWPQPNPDWPTIPGQPPTEPREIFYSQAQVANFTCPDGSTYSYTTPAGAFSSFSQDSANQMAYTFALNEGALVRICMGVLTPARTCAGLVYAGSITTSAGMQRVTYILTGGALPDGLLLAQSNLVLFIAGTPTIPGDYTFEITATDPNGKFQVKTYNLTVFGISTPSPLPNAEVGVSYSEILTYAGTPAGPVTWSISSGSLPAGLSLNSSTGEISGTPVFDGLQGFTISVNDGS